jgi:hypothetical protein
MRAKTPTVRGLDAAVEQGPPMIASNVSEIDLR